MAFSVQIEVAGIREALRFLNRLPTIWRVRTHKELTLWSKKLVRDARALSPEDKIRDEDRRRARKPGDRFKNQWRWEIKTLGHNVEVNIGNIDERAPNILWPTDVKGYIYPKDAPYLVFFSHRDQRWYTRFRVRKHKTLGQPVHEWTLQQFDLDGRVSKLANRLVRRS